MNDPFIHKFETEKNKYIFDVNSNEICQVDSSVYDLIGDVHKRTISDVIAIWKHIYDDKEIRKALRAIDKYRNQGLFSSQHPQKMVRNYSDDSLRTIIDSDLGSLTLNITEQCNFRCRYCSHSGTYFYERPHSNNSMSEIVLKKALHYYSKHSKNNNERSISFYGGEPLIVYEKIKYTIDILKELDPKGKYALHIDTNGLLLSEEPVMDFLMRHGDKCHLQISLDGPADVHDRFRVDCAGKPTFERIVNNLHLLRKQNKTVFNKIMLTSVITPKSDLFKMNDFFNTDIFDEVPSLNLITVNPCDTTFFTDYIEAADYTKISGQFEYFKANYIKKRIANINPNRFERALFDKDLITIHRRNINEPLNFIPPNGCCIPTQRRFFVDTDGTIRPCEKVGRAFCIGNVDNGIDAHLIDLIVDDYIALSNKTCLDCWAVRLCSTCISQARVDQKFSFDRKSETCRMITMNMHKALVDYSTIMESNQNAFNFVKDMAFK